MIAEVNRLNAILNRQSGIFSRLDAFQRDRASVTPSLSDPGLVLPVEVRRVHSSQWYRSFDLVGLAARTRLSDEGRCQTLLVHLYKISFIFLTLTANGTVYGDD
jgi:hypothetical protein